MPTIHWDTIYATIHEIAFLDDLHSRDKTAFLMYADIVLDDRRRWDETVDVSKVKAHLLRLMGEVQ